ncbi:hypothetical protein ACQ86N_38990 [Puia sp. P3]|uniref:hypothetical protein n=1 Tax=Puia sp. P3 TaxID=3423952 RepID=UPI003D67479A
MRKLIFGINTTLNGCCHHTKLAGEKEVLDYFAALLRGVDLPSQLMELGLIDEFQLRRPAAAGRRGRRLLQGFSLQERLKLAESTPFRSGTVAPRYTKQ